MKTPTFKPGLSQAHFTGQIPSIPSFHLSHPMLSQRVCGPKDCPGTKMCYTAVKLYSEDWLENKFGGVLALLLEIQFLSQGTKDK